MPSIIPGYEYDIFISYRQKDNKQDGWVTKFINSLKNELEATFKEDISIYFDENPHDGLHEHHEVDDSLREKLKCLIFIPIVSQTYCDPKCFAWEHEFKVFIEQAGNDQFGLKTKLSGGNVASRVLPVKIHDLDSEDQQLFESEVGGMMRSIDFIYQDTGVNRPLAPDDSEEKNLNGTKYKNQVNKVANAIKEIISGIKSPIASTQQNKEDVNVNPSPSKKISPPSKKKNLIYVSIGALILIVASYLIFGYTSFNSINEEAIVDDKLAKSLAVLPFDDMSPDKDQAWFSDGLSEEILNSLFQVEGLELRGKNSSFAFKGQGLTIKKLADTLNVNYVLEGSVRKIDDNLRITTQLILANEDVHIWSETFDRKYDQLFEVQTEIAGKVAQALNILLDSDERKKLEVAGTSNIEAYEYLLKGKKLFDDYHHSPSTLTLWPANEQLDNALELDSTIGIAYYLRADAFEHYAHLSMAGPEAGGLLINDAQGSYVNNLKKAVKLVQDKTTQTIINIELVTSLNDWSGLFQINSDFISNFKPSHLISSQFITTFVYLKFGEEVALNTLNKEIAIDPYNPSLYFRQAQIYIHSGKLTEAEKVLEKAYNLGVTMNIPPAAELNSLILSLLKGERISTNGFLQNFNDSPIAMNFIKALSGENIDPQINIENLNYESDANLLILYVWTYWELGKEEISNNVITKYDSQLSHRNDHRHFFGIMAFVLSYHIPFDIDAAPNFKARLMEAGIDPNRLKPMPRFSTSSEGTK